MGEFKGVWLPREILDLKLPLIHTSILSMAVSYPDDLRASNRTISEQLNTSRRTVIRAIIDLQEKGYITVSGNTSARVISANLSQVDIKSLCQSVTSTSDNMAQTCAILSKTSAILSPNRKDRKDIKEYKKVTLPEKPEYLALAKLIMTLHQRVDSKFIKSPDQLEKWAKDIRFLVEKDKRSLSEIESVIRWAKQPDCFWFPNIASGKKLREKFSTLYVQAKKIKKVPLDEMPNKDYAEGWA